jgi:F-type H+-transporting ATPase subunit b
MIGDLLISTAHAAEHGGHGDAPFYLDAHFWAAMAFLTIVLIILKAGFAKICAALDARGQAIRDRLDSARRIRDEAQALLAEYQRRQRDALQESKDILARAKNEAEKLKAEAAKDLEERVASAERQAMERIATAEEQAKREVRHIAVDVAVAAATRVMEEKLSAAQANALVDRAIAELPQKFN